MHNVCKICADTILASDDTSLCPLCRAPVSRYAVNHQLRNLLDDLKSAKNITGSSSAANSERITASGRGQGRARGYQSRLEIASITTDEFLGEIMQQDIISLRNTGPDEIDAGDLLQWQIPYGDDADALRIHPYLIHAQVVKWDPKSNRRIFGKAITDAGKGGKFQVDINTMHKY
jgi:hypothetical protein